MFEAYSIAVKVRLVNQASAGLIGLAGQFKNAEMGAAALERRMLSIRKTALIGGAMLGAGAFGLDMVAKMIKPASEYGHQLQLMNVAGMKHLEIVKATNAAWGAAKAVPTSTAAENLASIRELRMVFGDTQQAIQYMPVVQKMQGLLENLLGHGAGDQAYTIAKALEMKGAVKNPGMFVAQSDMMTKAITASGGKVGGQDFLSAFKYGRAATTGWSDAFAYTILPTLIQEMKSKGGAGGAGGPGNALMSAYATVVGGTIPQKSLKLWQQLELLDPSKVVWTKDGTAKGVAPGGVTGTAEFQANPYAWTQKYLMPAMLAHGYTTLDQQKQAMQYMFPNRTAGFIMGQMLEQPWKFQRDQKLIGQAMGIGGYDRLMKTDPEMAEKALQSQWKNLQAKLAFTILPQLISGFTKITATLESLTAWAGNNPGKVKILMWSFIGLSASLAFGGAVLLLSAAFHALGISLLFDKLGGAGGIIRIGKAIYTFGNALMFSQVSGPAGIMAAGKSLGFVATGLGVLTQAAAVFAAAYVGWKIGGLIYNKAIAGTSYGDAIGGTATNFMAAIGNKEAQATVARMKSNQSREAMIGAGRGSVVHVTNVHLDGKQVARTVTHHQVNAATRAQTGMSGFDATQFAIPIGAH